MLLLSSFFISGCLEEHSHDHSVEIEGKTMRFLSVEEIAYLWDVDPYLLLNEIINEFDLKGSYTIKTMLDDIREEYKFSPAMIKDMAEDLKNQKEAESVN